MVRTRMAPSPTGEYHIGGLRTYIYNYAFARKNNGKFLLRIEDTDQAREVAGAKDRLLEVIKDYGLDWDDYAVQSERIKIYQDYAKKLVESGFAYYCFCTEEDLQKEKDALKAAGSVKTMYSGKCQNLSPEQIKTYLASGAKYVIRLKVPKNELISVDDVVLGHMDFPSNDVDDTVLLKSDGFPTYHLAVVIDDHLMEVTHVFRGAEWLPSTPKHVLLYKAFGWDLPVYAHLPLLKEKGANTKLSKRYGDVSARAFLEKGYLPEAMLNFLMFLGWNPGTEKEIYSLGEFILDFSMERVGKTDLVVFDREKLLWYNGHYIRALSDEELWKIIQEWSIKYNTSLKKSPDDAFNIKVVGLIKERLKLLSEFSDLTRYFYEKPDVDQKLMSSFSDRSGEILQGLKNLFENVNENDWNAKFLDEKCHSFITEKGYKPKEAFMTLRVALTGVTATPGIFDVMGVLGKKEIIGRL